MNNLTLWFAKPAQALEIYSIINQSEDRSDSLWWNNSNSIVRFHINQLAENINQNPNRYIIWTTKSQIVWILSYFTKEDKLIRFRNGFDYELFQLFVSRDFQRQWIWKKLIKYFIESQENKNWKIYLMTSFGNENAIKFYKNIWFEDGWNYNGWEIVQKIMKSENLSNIYNKL